MPDPASADDTLRHELAAARAELQAYRRMRWLLPIARRMNRTAPGAVAPPLPVTDAPPLQAEAPPSAPSRMRGVALAAYRVARPVVRPVAWRSRSFLTGHVMAELLELRTKLDLLLARTEHETNRPLDPGVGSAAERALLTLALESRGPATPTSRH